MCTAARENSPLESGREIQMKTNVVVTPKREVRTTSKKARPIPKQLIDAVISTETHEVFINYVVLKRLTGRVVK